jgi:hypothetical protein
MFRFSIRDVLWLTVVVALAVGWWVDNKRIEKTVVRMAAEERLLREASEEEQKLLLQVRIKQEKILQSLNERPPIIVKAPAKSATLNRP